VQERLGWQVASALQEVQELLEPGAAWDQMLTFSDYGRDSQLLDRGRPLRAQNAPRPEPARLFPNRPTDVPD
jgi:hypothetical protein